MPECRCNECYYSRVIRGIQRGSMDCDPDEYYCAADEDDFFYTDWEYDEEMDEVISCPSFSENSYWED